MDADRLSRLRESVFVRDRRPFATTHPFVVRVNSFDTDTAPMRFSNFACAARVAMGVGNEAFVINDITGETSDYFKCCKHVGTLKWTHPDVM